MVVPLASAFSEAVKLNNVPAGQESLSLAEGRFFGRALSTLVTTTGSYITQAPNTNYRIAKAHVV